MRRALVAAGLLLAATVQAQTGTLAGTVTDAVTGAPVPGAAVVVEPDAPAPRGRAASFDGRFEIPGVASGRRHVRVRALGFTTVDTSAVVPPGGVARLDVALAPVAIAGAEVVVQARRAETATRADAPVLLVPQAVAVVPAAVLRAQDAQTAADALRNVPGATTFARGEPNAIPVLRGFETDRTGGGVRRNGIEVPYLSDGLQANVERVEVLRGPASVLYGRLEPGGVVNFVTARPGGSVTEVRADGGTPGAARGALDLGRDLSRRAAARLHASAGRTSTGRVEGATLFAAPALRWRPTDRWTVDADAEAVSATTVLDPGLAARAAPDAAPGGALDALDAVPADRFFGEPTARHRWRAASGTLGVAWAPRASLGVRTSLAASRSHLRRDALDLDSLTTLAGAPGSAAVARSLRRESLAFTYLKSSTFADVRARTGGVAHVLTVGAEALGAWAQVDNDAPLVVVGGAPVFALAPPVVLDAPRPTGLDASADARYLTARVRGLDAAVFAQERASVPLGSSAVLHAVASARLTHVRYGVDLVALASTPDAPAGASDRDAAVTALTPAVGLVAQLRSGLALYASAGTSFNPVVERVDRDGEPFRPTRGAQVEAGAKIDGPRAGASLAAFWLRKDDALTQGPDGLYDQTGRQRSLGVELDVRAAPVSGVTLLGTYAFLDAVVVADDNLAPGTRMPYAARHTASAWAEARAGGATLRAGAWLVGPRRGSASSDVTLPAQLVADVGAAWVVEPGVTLRLDARNVLGTRAWTGATLRPGTVGDALLVGWPAPVREVRLGVAARLP